MKPDFEIRATHARPASAIAAKMVAYSNAAIQIVTPKRRLVGKRFHITVRLALSCCFCWLASSGLAQAQEPVKLQLKWYHQFQFAGYYAALEKGYYRDAGLDVTIQEGGPDINAIDEVRSHRADFGVSASSALLSRARGDDIVVLAVIFQHSPSVLLVTRQSGIDSVKKLQNSRLMDALDCDDIAAMLKREGVDYWKMPRVKHHGDPRDLITGKADVMLAYTGNQAFVLDKLGVPYKEFTTRASGIDFYGDNLITSGEEITEHPERVKAFRAASLKGWKYAFSHKGEIADLILRRYSKAKTRDNLIYEANKYEMLMEPDLIELGYQNPARWQAIAGTYASLGMLSKAKMPAGLIYKPEVFAVPRWLIPVLLSVLGLSLAGFAINMRISLFNRRLKLEIDERREAEQAIAVAKDETEAMHRQLLAMSEALPLAIFRLESGPGRNLRYTFLSHHAEELLGVSHAELLACPEKRWRNVHPDDANLVPAAIMDASDVARVTGNQQHVEFTVRVLHGGVERWLLSSAHAEPALQDGIVVWNGFLQDITAQKLAEATITAANEQLAERSAELTQALDSASSRLQGILDNSPAAIWAKDEDGIYLFANEAYRSMFAIGEIEIEGRTDHDFFPHDTAEGFRANDQKVIDDRKTSSFVEKVGLPNGVEVVLSVKFPLFTENGDAYAAAGMCLDITGQLHLQEELKKLNEELEDRVTRRTGELTQAYEALRESESRLSKTTANAPCLIYQFITRPDGSAYFPYSSAFTKTYFGVDPEDVREDAGPILTLFHPDDVPAYLAEVERAIANQDVFKLEWRFLFPDGRITWAQATARPEFLDDGEILWSGVLMDITERKQTEQSLAEREAEFRTLIDNIPGVVYRCEAGGDLNMSFISNEIERLTGYPAADFTGEGKRNFNDLIHPDDREVRRNELLGAVNENQLYTLEYRMIHRDGSYRWVSCMGQAVRDERGKPLFFIGTIFDITQRKEAEQALLDSQLRVDLAAVAGELSFVDNDLVSNASWLRGHVARLVDSTDVLEVPFSKIAERTYFEDRDRVEAERQALLQGEATDYHLEYRIVDIQDAIHWLEARGKIIRDDHGTPVRISAVLLDTTERKRFEEELHAARLAADDSNKAKSDFLANMSHEIRTPMNAVIGLTHLALQTGLDDRQRNYLQKIDMSARNLLGIINDILDFSKIEAGKLQMEVADFNLNDVLQNVADMFVMKAQERGIEFLLGRDPDASPLLQGDPLRIGQILINLTSNAFKFTENGEVEVLVKEIAETADTVTLQFSVRDTGIGLTPQQQGRLFQAFSQADSSTTRKYGGTGLGLTISKRLVEMMQGRIWLESEAGVGTTFYFTTVLGKSIAEPSSDIRKSGELAGLRVLVVDDNSSARVILQGVLKTFNFQAITVSSGREALEVLKDSGAQPFDLVLMDWQMPIMDGIETARRIRSDPKLSYIPPIIMVSAYGREELMRQAAKVGISGYLIKPVNPSLLLDSIMQVFGKGGQFTATGASATTEDEAYRLRGLRVLLVEDNEINREVALEILANVGIIVEVAHDGAQGVAAIQAAEAAGLQFDAILMDCQMPVLDGYEATRKIRLDPRFSNLPIIAMTANAMAGDREKCLEAGMNDHVTKPIEVRALFGALTHWSAGHAAPPVSGTKAVPTPTADGNGDQDDISLPGVDFKAGLSHMHGNRALYRRILTKFREGQADAVQEFMDARAAGDGELAMRLAHTLKGVAGNIGANALAEAAGCLEQALKDTPQTKIDELLEEVKLQIDPIIAAISQMDAKPEEAEEITPAPQMAPLDHAALRSLLDKLEMLLDRSNTGASAVIEELRPLLAGTAYRKDLNDMTKAIEAYDFDSALEHLANLTPLKEGEARG